MPQDLKLRSKDVDIDEIGFLMVYRVLQLPISSPPENVTLATTKNGR